MTDVGTTSSTASATGPDRVTYGAVHLDVVDTAASLHFWRDIVGLVELPVADDEIPLGVDSTPLIVLHRGATRSAQPGDAGLYHVAIHLPDAAAFARVLARLAAHRVPQSPTDHLFSMATYATDPNGLMVELTLETPERFGRFELTAGSVAMYDRDGVRRGPTERLDLELLRDVMPEDSVEGPLPAGTNVGHVHLHVPDLGDAVAFYRDVIGLDEHMIMDAIGMADLSAGGAFPHRLALNIWNGPDAVQPPAGSAAMRRFELLVADRPAFDAVAERLRAAGTALSLTDDVIKTTDPAGNTIHVGLRA